MNSSNVIYTDLSEVLFEDRNKAYGGYQLRKKDGENTMIAFGLTIFAIVALLLLLRQFQHNVTIDPTAGILTLTEVNLPANAYVAPEPEAASAPEQASKAASRAPQAQETKPSGTPTPTPENVAVVPVTTPTNLDPGAGSTGTTTTSDPNATPCVECPPPNGKPGTTPAVDAGSTEPTPYEVFLGDMPVALNMNEVMQKVVYPPSLREMRMEGKASYRVLVDEDGNYVKHELIRASHPLFDQQCAAQLPALKFKPGKIGPHKVKVWVTVPFKFELKK